jgi:hypothetical protein
MSVISKLWRACLPPQRTFFLFHLVHLQIFAARVLGMLLCCVTGCSDLQYCSTVMDLTTFRCCCQIPHSMILSFVVAPHGFNAKAHSKVCD